MRYFYQAEQPIEAPTEESKELFEIVQKQPISQEDYEASKDIFWLSHNFIGNRDFDLRWACLQIYTAGKIAGIKEERKRRKGGNDGICNSKQTRRSR